MTAARAALVAAGIATIALVNVIVVSILRAAADDGDYEWRGWPDDGGEAFDPWEDA